MHASQGLEGLRAGDRVMIAIRPERLGLASEQIKANVMDSTVQNITFLGSIVRIQTQVGEHSLYAATFNRPSLELPKVGDQVQITCSAEAVLFLNRNSAG